MDSFNRSRIRIRRSIITHGEHGERESGGTTLADESTKAATAASGSGGPTIKSRRALIIGSAGSIAILAIALGLQAKHSWILKLPTQWLALAALPALFGLALGG